MSWLSAVWIKDIKIAPHAVIVHHVVSYGRINEPERRLERRSYEQEKQKKSGNKKDQPASKINLVTAIVNLVIAILLLIEKLTR